MTDQLPPEDASPTEQEQERLRILQRVEDWLEAPVMFLGLVWLALLLIELVWGLPPWLETFGLVIWGIFVVDYGLRLLLAPRKLTFIRKNWLTAISLLVPAVRILRVTRFARLLALSRTTRSLRLIKVVGSINRGMRALGNTMGRQGFGYVMILTAAVTFTGAAGLYAIEQEVNPGFKTYGDALWRTAMIMTTLGSDTQPQTTEGRLLVFLLALFAFAVFGYVTAFLATFFIGREAAGQQQERASADEINALRHEIAELRAELQSRNPEN